MAGQVSFWTVNTCSSGVMSLFSAAESRAAVYVCPMNKQHSHILLYFSDQYVIYESDIDSLSDETQIFTASLRGNKAL
jgi:hypothetical protein